MADERREATSERLLTLLAPLHDQALSVARRLSRCNADGDDLFQEAVLRAFDTLGSLRDESRFRSWFYAVLLSVHRRRHRLDFWRRLLPLDGASELLSSVDGEAESGGAERMARALATLSPKEREALVLFEIEGFTLEEIVALQGGSLSGVKSRLARSRTRLRRHYERTAGIFARDAMRRTP